MMVKPKAINTTATPMDRPLMTWGARTNWIQSIAVAVRYGVLLQKRVQTSAPMAFAAETRPTISNWPLFTRTAYMSCIA